MYEWDNEKNIIERGLDFADAEIVFSGTCATFEDTRFNYGEPRFITFGMLEKRLVVIKLELFQ